MALSVPFLPFLDAGHCCEPSDRRPGSACAGQGRARLPKRGEPSDPLQLASSLDPAAGHVPTPCCRPCSDPLLQAMFRPPAAGHVPTPGGRNMALATLGRNMALGSEHGIQCTYSCAALPCSGHHVSLPLPHAVSPLVPPPCRRWRTSTRALEIDPTATRDVLLERGGCPVHPWYNVHYNAQYSTMRSTVQPGPGDRPHCHQGRAPGAGWVPVHHWCTACLTLVHRWVHHRCTTVTPL